MGFETHTFLGTIQQVNHGNALTFVVNEVLETSPQGPQIEPGLHTGQLVHIHGSPSQPWAIWDILLQTNFVVTLSDLPEPDEALLFASVRRLNHCFAHACSVTDNPLTFTYPARITCRAGNRTVYEQITVCLFLTKQGGMLQLQASKKLAAKGVPKTLELARFSLCIERIGPRGALVIQSHSSEPNPFILWIQRPGAKKLEALNFEHWQECSNRADFQPIKINPAP